MGNRSIEEAIVMLKNTQKAVYVDETNREKLVALNYSDRDALDNGVYVFIIRQILDYMMLKIYEEVSIFPVGGKNEVKIIF